MIKTKLKADVSFLQKQQIINFGFFYLDYCEICALASPFQKPVFKM